MLTISGLGTAERRCVYAEWVLPGQYTHGDIPCSQYAEKNQELRQSMLTGCANWYRIEGPGGGSSAMSALMSRDHAKRDVMLKEIAPLERWVNDAIGVDTGGDEPAPPAPVKPAATPWYKNWKVLVPVGLGVSLLVGIGVYATRRRGRRRG